MQLFRKDLTQDIHERSAAWDGSITGGQHVQTMGLIQGTQVATSIGWRNIEAVQEGDKVLTFDEGLQKVMRIERHWIVTDHTTLPSHQWPLHIPAGTLGNSTDMKILPDQAVMIESDLGEEMFADPFTLVLARALIGFKGIEQCAPIETLQVVCIYFETEQVVFGNIGALFYCGATDENTFIDLMDGAYDVGYQVLPMSQATVFINEMKSLGVSSAMPNPDAAPTAYA